MFKAYQQLQQQNAVVKSLSIVIALLLMILLTLALVWNHLPLQRRMFLSQDMSTGAVIKEGQIPKSTIYHFAFDMFSAINTWTNSGTINYRKNIYHFHNYLSKPFFNALNKDAFNRKDNGSLARQRVMKGVSSMGYLPSRVKQLAKNLWQVTIAFEIKESIDGKTIKNVISGYPLLIKKTNDSIAINPWGLRIIGFAQQPFQIKRL